MAGTATRRKPPARKRAPKGPQVKPDDFVAIEQHLGTRELVERAQVIRLTTLTLLGGGNLTLLGGPGTGKSLTLRSYAKSFPDAAYYEEALNEELSVNEVIGPYDLEGFVNGRGLKREVTGFLGGANIAFLDERYRANGVLSNALLPIENVGERLLKLNGHRVRLPIKAIVAAANFLPDPDNVVMQASVSRVTLITKVERIRSDDSFKEMIRRTHDWEAADADRPILSLAQLDEAQRQVALVRPTPEFVDAAAILRQKAHSEGLPVDDRRWRDLYRICRAVAWMAGRDVLVADDLAACEMGMWREDSHIPIAHALTLGFRGRFEQEANRLRTEAAPNLAEWEQIRPDVDNTPPNEDVDPDVLRKGMSVQRKLKHSHERVSALLDEAAREQRDAATARELHTEIVAALEWFKASLGLVY